MNDDMNVPVIPFHTAQALGCPLSCPDCQCSMGSIYKSDPDPDLFIPESPPNIPYFDTNGTRFDSPPPLVPDNDSDSQESVESLRQGTKRELVSVSGSYPLKPGALTICFQSLVRIKQHLEPFVELILYPESSERCCSSFTATFGLRKP